MKVLVFDIFGDYGHFRKFYTTSSPLTFPFPPPPTIYGMVGAIYGAGKDEYLKIFDYESCKVALRIMNPVKKVRMGMNLIFTKRRDGKFDPTLIASEKAEKQPRTQIRTEFVKSPYYRIYLSHRDSQTFSKLETLLREHKSIYTLSLGLSELLANYEFIGVFESREINNGDVELVTPVLSKNLKKLEIEPERKYFKERIPIKMNPERVVELYEDVIFESDGKSIKASVEGFYQLESGENITFF